MTFKDFVQKLSSVLSSGTSTDKFTRSLFEALLTDDGLDILDSYKPSSYKGFYNGNTSITRISQKINTYVEPMEFSAYIHTFSDAAVENLCSIFSDDIPDINSHNAGDKLAKLFESIIIEAAGTKKKKSAPKDTIETTHDIPGTFSDIAPELTAENAGSIFFIDPKVSAKLNDGDDYEKEKNPFAKYLDTASVYHSTKKTLLYAEKPHPFYDLYVCSNIRYRKFRIAGTRDTTVVKTISNVTMAKLETESKYIIIQGIGGIGKSMLLTHLFLSSVNQIEETGCVPLLLSLKDYKDTTCGMVDFIWKSIKEYDAQISQASILDALQKKQLILLLDGLDEIQSSIRNSFDQDLDAFIKSFPGNTIVITSRPVNAFISYAKFSLFDIQELTKAQAIELVQKLEFWDNDGKNSFLEALDKTLYYSHREFASNPLLLTIMLMTYSSFGEVPAKMHVFYTKAYETMARLHDATKGSFQRPLHTALTPEEFAKYFSQFCARTYKDEVFEFDSMLFNAYMKKVLKTAAPEHQSISPRDFLLDLTDNLCIMYREGEKYYFIHRSFQEYFAAIYFASEYDANLYKVGSFFEKMKNRSYTDRTFDMLYDMIPEKIERFIFLPYLEKLITDCCQKKDDEYWEFLEQLYPYIVYEEGNPGESYLTEASSFLYRCIIREKHLASSLDIDDYGWPEQIHELPAKTWVEAYSEFLDYDAYDNYPDPEAIPDRLLDFTSIVEEDALPYKYSDYFGEPEQVGLTIEIDIYELRKNPHRYIVLRNYMEHSDFPFLCEYQAVKNYYDTLKKRTLTEIESDDLFDD